MQHRFGVYLPGLKSQCFSWPLISRLVRGAASTLWRSDEITGAVAAGVSGTFVLTDQNGGVIALAHRRSRTLPVNVTDPIRSEVGLDWLSAETQLTTKHAPKGAAGAIRTTCRQTLRRISDSLKVLN